MVSQQAGSSNSVEQIRAQSNANKYQAEAEVGRGGVGKVIRTLEKPLGRRVALKTLLDSSNHEYQRRFIREAKITGAMEHPSIVPVHELNVDQEGQIYYTMKLVKGVTLQHILNRLAGPDASALSEYRLATLLTIFQKICDAVAFAHNQSPPVIHRDLKPANIMIGDYGEVLVMDWGAAKLLNEEQEPGEFILPPSETGFVNDILLTKPGSVMGTPGYMAPEQTTGRLEITDERTDIYALGSILYSILTLEVPERITTEEVEELETKSDPKTATTLFQSRVAPHVNGRRKLDHLPNRAIPESLKAVALKAMSFYPNDRYRSVKDLQADVAAYQAGRATRAEEAGAWRQLKLLVARNRTLFGAIAASFVILVGATAVSMYQRRTALKSNEALVLTLHRASQADHETAHQRFRIGAWREGLALLVRSLTFWPENREASNYLLSAILFGHGDGDKLPIFGVYHNATIAEPDFSPDGRYFATASYDGTARVWESVTGAPIGKAMEHPAPVCYVRFSSDSRKIVTAAEKGTARVWDARTGEPLTNPLLHGKPEVDSSSNVVTAVFSSDGRYVLTACEDHTTRVWNAETGEELVELPNPNRASAAVFSPDGSRILGSSWRGATLWDAKTFQQIGPFMNHATTVRRSLFTPDGKKIITGDLRNKMRIWDGYSAQPLVPFINHPDPVWDLDMSPDGKLFATAFWGKTARLWSTLDASPVGAPLEHDGPVDSIVFSPKGDRLVSASRDKTVRVWDVATCKQIGNPMRHDETVMKAIFNPDGTKILSVGADTAGYLWNLPRLSWPGEVIPISSKVCSIEFDQGDDHILVTTQDGQIGLWSLVKNGYVTPIIRQGSSISVAGFHLPSHQIATASDDGIIRVWNVLEGRKISEASPTKDKIVALEFASDGRSVFSAHMHGTVLQWKIPEGTQAGSTIKLSENMDALAVAPVGNEIATGAGDDLFQFWDPTTGKPSRKEIRHSTSALALNYSPDGHFIAAGCEDHTARIWSLDSRQQDGEPFYLKGRVTAVRYTPNGNELFVGGSEDTEVNCYDAKTHNSLYLPLPHPTGVSHITSNADGSLVITVTNDGVARLWRIPITSEAPPKWLPDYIRALGGLAFTPQQQLVQVSTRERLELRKKLLGQPVENTLWDKIMRLSFAQNASPAPSP